MKIIKKTTTITGNNKPSVAYECNDGSIRTVKQLADVAGIQPATMRERIKDWGMHHPEIFRGYSNKKAAAAVVIDTKIDIVVGDLYGKYSNESRSERLVNIPSCTEIEKALYV